MPEIFTYSHSSLPDVLKWQAIAFMRVVWSDIFSGENQFMEHTYPPDHDPVHFGIAHGDSLISYASILKLNLVHNGCGYSVLGFGNMFTFPPYQNQGYGSQVLHCATEYIQNSSADLAMLFCNPRLEPFYAAYGWTASRGATYIGPVADKRRYEELRMMLFVSDKGKHGREDFENHPLSLDWPW